LLCAPAHTLNEQVVTLDVMRSMGLVSALTDVAIKKGPQVAKAVMNILSADNTG
jgi:hypothetical protein